MTRFIDQEYFHDPANGSIGDCWRACLASILDRPAAEIPHFVRDHGDQWFTATTEWLSAQHGETILYYDTPVAVDAQNRAETTSRLYVMLDGKSPRGDFYHVVIADATTGQIIHDPHPSRTGLATVTGVFVLVDAAVANASAAMAATQSAVEEAHSGSRDW